MFYSNLRLRWYKQNSFHFYMQTSANKMLYNCDLFSSMISKLDTFCNIHVNSIRRLCRLRNSITDDSCWSLFQQAYRLTAVTPSVHVQLKPTCNVVALLLTDTGTEKNSLHGQFAETRCFKMKSSIMSALYRYFLTIVLITTTALFSTMAFYNWTVSVPSFWLQNAIYDGTYTICLHRSSRNAWRFIFDNKLIYLFTQHTYSNENETKSQRDS